jgi:hypothetical protein
MPREQADQGKLDYERGFPDNRIVIFYDEYLD